MNKWKPEMHKFDDSKTYHETEEGNSMTSLRGYLDSIGNPEIYYCTQYKGFISFWFDDKGLNGMNANDTIILSFVRDSYRWTIVDDKELYITEKNNPLAQTYVFIPMAPALFSKGGVQ